jgi:dTDP-4-dehydrorhamnose 3,5-epimerase
MIFNETRIRNAFIIEIEKRADERGYFARAFCQKEMEAHGLNTVICQANIALSRQPGTLRGMHYQAAPYQEAKLVRCIAGAAFDAIIDLRPDSPSYKRWLGVELSSEKQNMIYVPEGCAHGYLTLAENTEIYYQVSQFYAPAAERGIRWNDPAFAIEWPVGADLIISEKDQNWPNWSDPRHAGDA